MTAFRSCNCSSDQLKSIHTTWLAVTSCGGAAGVASTLLGCRRRQTTLAGFPNTTTFGGTLEATTDPAPTMELAPIRTPLRTMAPAPIQAFLPIETGLER